MNDVEAECRRLLRQIYRKERHVARYLRSKQPTLDDRIPLEMIESGDGQEVIQWLRTFLKETS